MFLYENTSVPNSSRFIFYLLFVNVLKFSSEESEGILISWKNWPLLIVWDFNKFPVFSSCLVQVVEIKFKECLGITNFRLPTDKSFVCGLNQNSYCEFFVKLSSFSCFHFFFYFLQHERPSTYDRINHVVEGYNQKLHRDDREHAKSRGLKVNKEVSIFNDLFWSFVSRSYTEKLTCILSKL